MDSRISAQRLGILLQKINLKQTLDRVPVFSRMRRSGFEPQLAFFNSMQTLSGTDSNVEDTALDALNSEPDDPVGKSIDPQS